MEKFVREKWKRRLNLDSVLPNYDGIYAIDCLFDSNVKYGIEGGDFAILTPYHGLRVRISDIPELCELLPKSYAEEVKAIYEDVKGLGLDRLW